MVDWIKARRSIRAYTSDPVPDGKITSLLEAAMAAPSASNRQPWEFVVVRDVSLRASLGSVHPGRAWLPARHSSSLVCGRPRHRGTG